VIASEPLYRRLQVAEGLGGDDTLANMPTLTKAQLRGIFAGGTTALFDWDQVYVTNAAGVQTQVGDGTATHPTIICRRGDTSGTMTSFKIQFLEQGCAKGDGIAKFISPDDLTTEQNGVGWDETNAGITGAIVFAGSGTGDVISCTSYGTAAANGTARNEYRLGIIGSDNLPKTSGGSGRFRYVRVDGQEPTLVATQQGRYDFFTEPTLNDRNVALGGNLDGIWSFVKAKIANRVAVAAANTPTQNAAAPTGADFGGVADTGILVGPTSSIKPIFPIVAANVRSELSTGGGPVNSSSRTTPGASINNCNNTMQVVP
jgi:hypothetical protein